MSCRVQYCLLNLGLGGLGVYLVLILHGLLVNLISGIVLTRENQSIWSPPKPMSPGINGGVRLNNGTYKFFSSSLPRERVDLSKLVLSLTLFSFLVAKALIPSFVQSTFVQSFHSIALNR